MKKNGFTLVELLIVMAIIGVLAGLVLVAVRGANVKARIGLARTTIDNLRTALTAYCEEVGFYPVGQVEEDDGNIKMVLALSDPGAADGGLGGPSSPYYEFRESDLKYSKYQPSRKVLVDPWGEPWRYVSARDEHGDLRQGIHMRHSYDLWSPGPNMKDEGGTNDGKDKDDVANWH